jgi:hypothetical protein
VARNIPHLQLLLLFFFLKLLGQHLLLLLVSEYALRLRRSISELLLHLAPLVLELTEGQLLNQLASTCQSFYVLSGNLNINHVHLNLPEAILDYQLDLN